MAWKSGLIIRASDPAHQRYCWLRNGWMLSGHRPLASTTGTYEAESRGHDRDPGVNVLGVRDLGDATRAVQSACGGKRAGPDADRGAECVPDGCTQR